MFNRVLVGIDEETDGEDALALARRLMSPNGRLILAHVHAGSPALGKGNNGEFEAIARDEALALLRSVLDQNGLDADICCIGADRVGAGLHRLAEMAEADLLVLGSSHNARRARVLLEEETRHALNGAPCAVAVAPRDYCLMPSRIMEIGVAYNGSEESRTALTTARALATQLRANATVFEALPMPAHNPEPGVWDGFDDEVLPRQNAARKQISDECGLPAFASCGETVQEIAIYSASVDLLIVSSRDYGPVGRLVHGSTTRRLLGITRSPLLILTRAARRKAQELPAQEESLALAS